jgi:hypothetical protein
MVISFFTHILPQRVREHQCANAGFAGLTSLYFEKCRKIYEISIEKLSGDGYNIVEKFS